MGGVAGIDMEAVLSMARARGYDERAMSLLLPFGEAALVTAVNRKDGDSED